MKQRNALKTRQLVLERSAGIFNTKGFAGTSLHDITQATGMTKGAIYAHFRDKEDVALQAFDYVVQKLFGLLEGQIKAGKTAPEKLRNILSFYQSYIAESPIKGGCPILNTSIDADDTHPALRLKVVRTIEQMRGALRKIVLRGIAMRQFTPHLDVEQFITMYLAMLEGGIMLSKVEGDVRSIEQVITVLDAQISQFELHH